MQPGGANGGAAAAAAGTASKTVISASTQSACLRIDDGSLTPRVSGYRCMSGL
jgi:hypothetical protein